MKRYIAIIAAMPFALGVSMISASPANATSDTSCVGVNVNAGTDTCSDVVQSQSDSEAHASTSASVTSVNGVDIHSSVQVVSYIQEKGATKAQMHGKKFRLKHSERKWTSYFDTNGHEVWHWKWYPKGYLFVKGRDGYWHDPHCWNKVVGIPNGKKHIGRKVYGKIKIVQKFVFSASSVSSVSDSVTAKAMAWANTDTCHAEASATGSANFAASASASFSGYVKVDVLATVRAQSQHNLSVKLKGASLVDIHGTTVTSARGNATADASAHAACSGPNVGPPSIQTVETVNDVLLNNTRTIRVTGIVPAGRFATLNANACNGGSIVADNNQVVSGTFDVTVTYQAPSEVPGANTSSDCAVPAGKERVNFTLTDTANATLKDTSDTVFVIKQPVPDQL